MDTIKRETKGFIQIGGDNMKSFKTIAALNPKLKDYLIIADSEEPPKTYLIPSVEFTNLLIEAGRRFNTLAPLAPYPHLLGCEWKANNTTYKWFRKRLIKIQENYNFLLDQI